MKKLALIVLLLSSQVSYASQINSRRDVERKRCFVALYFAGATMFVSGLCLSADAVVKYGKNSENENYYNVYAFSTMLVSAGSGIIGASLVAMRNEIESFQRNSRNVGEYQAMPIGEDNV